MAEDFGVRGRGRFYEEVGAIRGSWAMLCEAIASSSGTRKASKLRGASSIQCWTTSRRLACTSPNADVIVPPLKVCSYRMPVPSFRDVRICTPGSPHTTRSRWCHSDVRVVQKSTAPKTAIAHIIQSHRLAACDFPFVHLCKNGQTRVRDCRMLGCVGS